MGNTMGSSNIVGNKLFFEVLKRLGLHDSQEDEPCVPTDPTSSSTDEKDADANPQEPARPSISPSPEAAVKFVGSYTHPAYGTIDVTDAGALVLSSLEANITLEDVRPDLPHPATLHVRPSQRTWPNEYALRQDSTSGFHMDVFFQRGSDDTPANDIDNSVTSARSLAYKNIKVLEYLYTGKAVFEDDEAGSVNRLGMEVSPELADSEAAKVDSKAGMIWFERL
jgi:hypothetical protein